MGPAVQTESFKLFDPLSLGQHGKRKFDELRRARNERTALTWFDWYGISDDATDLVMWLTTRSD